MGHVLRVIDFETTGMEPPAEVVEVGYCDLSQEHAGGMWAVGEPVSWLCGADAIPPEVRAVHHISAIEVFGKPKFDAVRLGEDASHCGAIVAHNMEFEAKFIQDLVGVVPMICTYKAALRVWPDAPGHSNSVLRYWLEDQGLTMGMDQAKATPPHRAGPDAYVTAWILRALLTRCTGREMAAWTKQPRLLPTCPIGKFRGKPWPEVETGFLSWMLAQPTMEADLKWNAQRELDRREAERAASEAAAEDVPA